MEDILDIDRLHDVIRQLRDPEARTKLPAAAGKTTAYMYLMLDEIIGGDYNNQYLYSSEGDIREAAKNFALLISEYGYRCNKVLLNKKQPVVQILETKQLFKFAPVKYIVIASYWDDVRYDRIFLDVVPDYMYPELYRALEYEVACYGGDIV